MSQSTGCLDYDYGPTNKEDSTQPNGESYIRTYEKISFIERNKDRLLVLFTVISFILIAILSIIAMIIAYYNPVTAMIALFSIPLLVVVTCSALPYKYARIYCFAGIGFNCIMLLIIIYLCLSAMKIVV